MKWNFPPKIFPQKYGDKKSQIKQFNNYYDHTNIMVIQLQHIYNNAANTMIALIQMKHKYNDVIDTFVAKIQYDDTNTTV